MCSKGTRLIIISVLICFIGCTPTSNNEQLEFHPGQSLSKKYCRSCHMEVDPADLPRATWERDVLPKMAARMGLSFGPVDFTEALKKEGLFPESALLSAEEWAQIQGYILANAPILPAIQNSLKPRNLSDFSIIIPSLRGINPMTTLLSIDEQQSGIYFGNNSTAALHFLSADTLEHFQIKMTGIPIKMAKNTNELIVLNMGQVMPHNDSLGNLALVDQLGSHQWTEGEALITGLKRPVDFVIGDLDLDGYEDLVVSNFGNLTGSLEWYQNYKSSERIRKILSPLPGSVKSVILDANGDKLPDILSLMAQGDEGFWLYVNEGNGSFNAKRLLQFPPTYGSTYFELVDWNKDGHQDILYVNGDNGDYFPVVKEYHGIRIFLNNGLFEFKEELFLPLPGAFKSIAKDFDQDGDLDLAAISYFPDYSQASIMDFVLFKNEGGKFIPNIMTEGTQGKWLTMDAGDVDADGDIDIVLGSAIFMQAEVPRSIQFKWRKAAPPIVILENELN